MTKCILGVDIGTSSAKAVVAGTNGEILFEAQQHYTISEPYPGYRQQDADEILSGIFEVIKNASLRLSNSQTLVAIGFSAAMHSLMAVNANGKPITPLLLWADTRSKQQSEQLAANSLASQLYEQTGLPNHPMTPLCKILWIHQNEPETFKNAFKFISIKEYLFFKLTGQYVIDHSMACATGLFNIHQLQWHQPALALAGVTDRQLSTPVSPFDCFYCTDNLLCDQLHITKQIPLVIGSTDGCLANIGSGVETNKEVSVTIGTSMAVRVTTTKPVADKSKSLFNYVVRPDLYICGGGSNSGSLLLKWMAGNMLENPLLANPEAFIEKAFTAPAGCEGLIFVPYLLGERAPVWNANATGVLSGVQFHHKQHHFMRALVEGLTMNACVIIETLQAIHPGLQKIKASGGFTNSGQWLQLLADVSNLPVVVYDRADASAFGAIIVAGYSTGIFSSLHLPAAFDTMASVYEPNHDNYLVYQQNFMAFKRLHLNTNHS